MKTYINEIRENDQVDSLFLVKEKSSGITKTGNTYLKLKLVDRSGEMEGRVWTLVENLTESFEKDDFVRILGKAVSFQEHLQLNINYIERVREEAILFSDFFPVTEKDVDEMFHPFWKSVIGSRTLTSTSFSSSSGKTNPLSSSLRWPLRPNGSTTIIWVAF